jgi:hypothetical protein
MTRLNFAHKYPALTVQRKPVQLKVVNWRGEVTASEPITDLAAASSANAGCEVLSAFYPVQTSLPIDERLAKAPLKAEYKWWPDGYEPIYYILTPQARRPWTVQESKLGVYEQGAEQAPSITLVRNHFSALIHGDWTGRNEVPSASPCGPR